MITKKDLLKNINNLKERLEKNEINFVPGQEAVMNSPVYWTDKDKDIFFFMRENQLIFQNKMEKLTN